MNFTEPIPFKGQQPMHIPYIPEVFFPFRFRADGLFPGMNELKDTCHHGSWERRWPFGKSADEFVKKLLSTYLQMKWVSTGLNERVEEGESEHGNMWISVIDESDSQHRSLPRPEVIREMRVDRVSRITVQTYVLAFFWFIWSATSRFSA